MTKIPDDVAREISAFEKDEIGKKLIRLLCDLKMWPVMVAAPRMLEALKEVRELMDAAANDIVDVTAEDVDRIDAAIAAAEETDERTAAENERRGQGEDPRAGDR